MSRTVIGEHEGVLFAMHVYVSVIVHDISRYLLMHECNPMYTASKFQYLVFSSLSSVSSIMDITFVIFSDAFARLNTANNFSFWYF